MKFNLSTPKNITFFIALIIAVVALLMMIIPSFNLPIAAVWVALIAFAILALGNLLKGL
jgi:lipoprotein signal peptidase